jgi:hypothetical protein
MGTERHSNELTQFYEVFRVTELPEKFCFKGFSIRLIISVLIVEHNTSTSVCTAYNFIVDSQQEMSNLENPENFFSFNFLTCFFSSVLSKWGHCAHVFHLLVTRIFFERWERRGREGWQKSWNDV